MGVVRATEVRVAPEVEGQLAVIRVGKGARVRAGDIVAELSAIELTAAVGQARATLAAATANRDHVYAGVRAEQVAALAAEIAKAKARLDFAEIQLSRTSYLERSDVASHQALDQAQNDAASARADVAEAEANHAAAKAGPTREERAIADAQVAAAASALAVLERRLEKTVLRAPADGVVSVIVAEVGENIRAGQPVLVIEETGKQWLSFNALKMIAWSHRRSDRRHSPAGRKLFDARRRDRDGAARRIRHLAGRARHRRSRPQYPAPAPRSAR